MGSQRRLLQWPQKVQLAARQWPNLPILRSPQPSPRALCRQAPLSSRTEVSLPFQPAPVARLQGCLPPAAQSLVPSAKARYFRRGIASGRGPS